MMMMMMMIYLFFGCFFYSNINRSSYHQVLMWRTCTRRERRKRRRRIFIFCQNLLVSRNRQTKNQKFRFLLSPPFSWNAKDDEIKKIKRDWDTSADV